MTEVMLTSGQGFEGYEIVVFGICKCTVGT